MINNLSQLKHHAIVIVANRRDRGIVMQNILAKFGFKIVVTLSLYDALQYISQQMPHLIITEPLLTDGHAGILFDRLSQHPALKNVPILLNVINKTKEELIMVRARKFAGFVLGPPNPKALLEKILEILATRAVVSPYAFDITESPIAKKIMISIDATIVGATDQQLIAKSGMEIDSNANLVCVPVDRRFDPAILRLASNLKKGSQIFNLFPLNRVMGKGRQWIQKLPAVNTDTPAPNAAPARVEGNKIVFFDPSEERFHQFRDILLGYGIDLIYAASLQRALSVVRQRQNEITCIYLHELLNNTAGIEWRKQFATLPAVNRPTLVIGTSSLTARSTPGVRFIRRPFGLGILINTLQATFEKAEAVSEGVETNGYVGIPARYQAPATLVGLDELGGVLEVRFPIAEGGRLKIEHDFLTRVWEDNNLVSIVGVTELKNKVDTWWIRFQAVEPSASKTKYWTKMAQALSDLKAKSEKTTLGQSA